MPRCVLALDQGGHASRACLVDEHGEIRIEASSAIDTAHAAGDQVQHDAEQILASVRASLHEALRRAGDLEPVAVGLATQRSTLVCFSRASGAALSPALSWQDRRGAKWLAMFAADAARVTELTGLPLSAHYGVSKMRWCLDRLPSVQQAAARGDLCIAPLATYLLYHLTEGTLLADPANASRTLLWDCARRDWSPELLQLFDIDPAVLPPSGPTQGQFGQLRLAAQRLPVRAVSGDQSAVPFAFGRPDPDTLYVNLGTGAFLQRPQSARPLNAAPLLASVLAADAHSALYSLEGTVNGAASALTQFVQSRALNEAALWQQLQQAPAMHSLPLFINGVGGLGSPYWRAAQRSYFIDETDALSCFAAVLESVLFLIAINAELMQRRAGAFRRVLLSGGLSQSDWLCRRLAALLAVPVQRGAHEATVLGIAALAAPEASVARPSAAADVFAPDALRAAELNGLRSRLRRFQEALET